MLFFCKKRIRFQLCLSAVYLLRPELAVEARLDLVEKLGGFSAAETCHDRLALPGGERDVVALESAS